MPAFYVVHDMSVMTVYTVDEEWLDINRLILMFVGAMLVDEPRLLLGEQGCKLSRQYTTRY